MSRTGERIAWLSKFMREERYDMLCRTLEHRTRYMTVCLENIYHSQNASAVVRSCEAFGIQDIHAVEAVCRFSPNTNIVRGTDKWVDIHRYREDEYPVRELVHRLRKEGYRIVATSPHAEGATPETFDVRKGKFALFFGTEKEGISEEVKREADEFIRIPMVGFVESLNISVSAAILLYQLSQRVREQLSGWELTGTEKQEVLLRWRKESVEDSHRLLDRLEREEVKL